MPDDQVQFKLLMPTMLKKTVQRHAQDNNRSLSSEIITALEKVYGSDGEPSRLITEGELDLEGKVTMLERLVADLLNEAVEDGRITDQQLKDRLGFHKQTIRDEEENPDIPNQVTKGSRITLGRIRFLIAMREKGQKMLQARNNKAQFTNRMLS